MAPLITVVVPTYNYGHFLRACLQSIISQSFAEFEVVVVNDGSTDNTLDVLREFSNDRRIRCYTQNNQGCIPAMNKGIEIARGSYLTFAGSDDLYNRDHLKGLADAMQRHPEAGMVFDNAALFTDGADPRAQSLLISADIAEKLNGQRVPFKSIFFNNWVLNTSMFVRRTVLDQVGAFKAEIPKTGDFHLVYRIGALFPVFFVNYVGTRIRCHPQSMMHREPYYEANVRCLEDIRDNHPEVQIAVGRRAFAKRLGRKYFRLARYYEHNGDFIKARITYEKAFRTRPTRPWYYVRSLALRARG